jgi:predicted transcriptional regulator
MTTQRKFRPRKALPKDELIQYLEEGLTLTEIANKYGVAVSYISEYLKMLGIDIRKDIKGRSYKVKQRKEKLGEQRKTFINEFYKQIEGELHAR